MAESNLKQMRTGQDQKQLLIDEHGRKIRKLRVSLLEDCNLRCFYCMPKNIKFPHHSKRMSVDEIIRLIRIMLDYGIERVRLTGGEPTMRPEFEEIVSRLSELPIERLALTTNGSKLEKLLPFLKTTNLRYINISLDSLKAGKFKKITNSNIFGKAMSANEATAANGFYTKINVLAMRGVNDDEILDFVDFSERTGIEVRFLELMRIGSAIENQKNQFIKADDIIDIIHKKYELQNRDAAHDSTSINYKTPAGGLVGIIASESKPFCGNCSRWRLSANGKLRPCLMKTDGHQIAYKDENEIHELFMKTLKMKPIGRVYEMVQNMNEVGG